MTAARDPQKIHFNVATAEREKTYEPFVLALSDGSTIVMTDPRELDWQDLLTIENPADFFRFCVSDEDKDKLRKEKIPGWKFNDLITEYQLHYGLGDKGNGAGSRTF